MVEIYGKLVDELGNPLPFYSICIQAFNTTQTGYGWSNSDGGFSGKVPKNEMLNFIVKDDCGDVVFEQKIGPFNTAVSMGNIVIQNRNQVSIFGVLLDCDKKPVSNGYVKIELEGVENYYIVETNELGEWVLNLVRCLSIDAFTVQGVDLDNLTVSEILTIEAGEQPEILVEDLIACADLDEFIQVKLESGDIFLNTDVDAQIIDGTLHISTGWDSLGNFVIQAQIADVQQGANTDINYLSIIVESPSVYFQGTCGNSGQLEECDFTFTIDQIGLVGDYIEGTYMGELYTFSSGSIETIMGSFRIKLDQIIDRGSVSGSVWLDDNMNGIREAGETSGEVRSVILYTVDGNPVDRATNASEYELFFNEAGEYYLVVELYGGYQLSPMDQGTDDSLDSDFDPGTFRSEVFYLDAGQKVSGYDIGVSTNGFLYCFVNQSNDFCFSGNGQAEVVIEGSIPPFYAELTIDGVTLIDLVTDEYTLPLNDLFPGNYFVQITDNNGNVCETEFVIENLSLECWITATQPLCTRNDGSLEANSNIGQLGFNPQYIWSNGSTVPSLQNLAPGIYTVTITDEFNQCEAVCSFELLSLGDETSVVGKVWADSLGMTDNIYDSGDFGISQIEVRLYASPDLTNPLNTTFTDNNGVYSFENLLPGEYQVEVIPYPNATFVDLDAGMDDTIDSDIDPTTGRSAIFELDVCNVIDAGLKEE